MTALPHVTILGAGLTGLTAAYRLSRSCPSTKITLLEASSRVGGWVGSTRHPVRFKDEQGQMVEGEVTLDSGPRSIRPRGSRGAFNMLRLIRDLELEDHILPVPLSHPAAKNRFLLDAPNSQLVKLPSSPTALFGLQPRLLRGLLASIIKEPFRPKDIKSPDPSNAECESLGDESVDSLVRRRLGPKVANTLISAMVHGIYATDSRTLSVRSSFPVLWEAEAKYGSIVLGMLMGTKSKRDKVEEKREWETLGELGKRREDWSLYGLKGGLGALTRRLEEEVMKHGVDIRRDEAVTQLQPNDGGTTVSTLKSSFNTSHVISALSPSTLSTLIPLPFLNYNPSTTVGVINIVYPLPPSQIHPAGFGYLIPRTPAEHNPEGILGVIFDSTAIPGNDDIGVESKVTKLTVMMGGPWWSSYPATSGTTASPPADKEALVEPALRHLCRVFPNLAGLDPLLVLPHLQKNCIPTYLPGHGQRLQSLLGLLSNRPGTAALLSEGSEETSPPLRDHLKAPDGKDVWAGKLSVIGSGYGGVGVNDCVHSAEAVVDGLKEGERPTGLERWKNWV